MVFSFLETMIKDGMKVFLEQAVGFLDDLKNVVAEIEDIKATTTLKKDTEKEVQKIYSQLDTIVDWLNKQSKKVQSKIAKVEEMFVWFINESNKRNKSMQDKMKEEIKADITAFWPLFNNLKETLKTAENDILRNREDLEKMLEKKLEKWDLKYLEDWLQKTFIDDENISDKTAYSSKKTIEKIDSMINNLRLWGRGKIFIQNDWIDLWQATAINFTGSGVTTTVENWIHTVDISGWWAWAVDSVNWQTWVVVLDADDIDDTSTTNKFVTSWDLAKLSNITVTQAVDLDQMENDIAALANGMVYKGNWDASAWTFPWSWVAQTWWFYTVSVWGTVDWVVFNVDDRLVATTDNASATTYAWNWTKLDATDAVTSVNGAVGNVTVQSLPVIVSASQTAVIDEVYIVVASATFTDPSPVEWKGFKVIVRNGTATVWWTGYSVAWSEIMRIYHSWAWANYLKTPSSWVNTGDQTSIVWITGTLAEFNAALTGADFATLAWSEALTNKSVNWVTLVSWWTATKYLSEDGTYTTPAWWSSWINIRYSLTGSYASTTTFTFSWDAWDAEAIERSLFTCLSSADARKIWYVKSASHSAWTVTVTVVTDVDLASWDKTFKVAINRKVEDYQHLFTIPWEQIADASNPQGMFYRSLVDTYLLPVNSFVRTAAAWTWAACAWNVYKWTTNLFTSAQNMATNDSFDEKRPNTNTISAWDIITLRVTSSAWATNKASDLQVQAFIVPQTLYTTAD